MSRAAYWKVKRMLDLIGASVALVLSAPVIGLCAILIRARMGSPVLWRERRPGLRAVPFTLFKFRTMTNATGPDGKLLSDAERLTSLGRFLRATSLDELPQLVNVLRGEMSFVGPRPLLLRYVSRYTPEQARRHSVPPGITGWAQVNGRNALSWDEKFALDVWYADYLSFGLDCRILWLTLIKVLTRDGISQNGHATMPEFMGSEAVAADNE